MALGDGIRRNLSTVSPDERLRLRNAFVELNKKHYAGSPTDTQFGRPVPGGVSYWFKQDEIHARTGVHRQPIFLPWHRELLNRLEQDLRAVDPELSLHYWDWTTDPRAQVQNGTTFSFFTPDFMGAAIGAVGEPWLSAGIYDPAASPPRSNNPHGPNYNASFVPRDLSRRVRTGVLHDPSTSQDVAAAADYAEVLGIIESLHDDAHGYVGGTLGDPHISFRDPIVFLLHANVDRLFALWQLQPGHPERLDPATVYGAFGNSVTLYDGAVESHDGLDFVDPDDVIWGLSDPMMPWSGFEFDAQESSGTMRHLAIIPIRPWCAPENEHIGHAKSAKDPSVVTPPQYDTNP